MRSRCSMIEENINNSMAMEWIEAQSGGVAQ